MEMCKSEHSSQVGECKWFHTLSGFASKDWASAAILRIPASGSSHLGIKVAGSLSGGDFLEYFTRQALGEHAEVACCPPM
jgi:hypothetical protein